MCIAGNLQCEKRHVSSFVHVVPEIVPEQFWKRVKRKRKIRATVVELGLAVG
jgi:hypothetical protein